MKIFIGADHAGFAYKERIIKYLQGKDFVVEDLGNENFRPRDDYPDFAKKVAGAVAKNPQNNRGILICDSGVGMQISANRIKKVRAVNAWNSKIAAKSREHNNTNVLCLASHYLSFFKVKKIINTWLNTDFSSAKRHHRRVNKI